MLFINWQEETKRNTQIIACCAITLFLNIPFMFIQIYLNTQLEDGFHQ